MAQGGGESGQAQTLKTLNPVAPRYSGRFQRLRAFRRACCSRLSSVSVPQTGVGIYLNESLSCGRNLESTIRSRLFQPRVQGRHKITSCITASVRPGLMVQPSPVRLPRQSLLVPRILGISVQSETAGLCPTTKTQTLLKINKHTHTLTLTSPHLALTSPRPRFASPHLTSPHPLLSLSFALSLCTPLPSTCSC